MTQENLIFMVLHALAHGMKTLALGHAAPRIDRHTDASFITKLPRQLFYLRQELAAVLAPTERSVQILLLCPVGTKHRVFQEPAAIPITRSWWTNECIR